MADPARNSQITSSPLDRRGHPVPRRASPEQSVTLQHHRLAREASKRPSPAGALAGPSAHSPRRHSSGESHDTEPSDPKKWFDKSNRNPSAPYDAPSMDVDPPFFQQESESSNEGAREPGPGGPGQAPFPFALGAPPLRATVTHSSSADDYRSVIDDLTIENKRLKEELKRYKQIGPAMMRKDKLFEIKVHGLPKRKKRELEATLLEFAAGLETSSDTPSQRRKGGRHGKGVPSSGESMSKHASSSSSHSRPVDSAYASMSTGVSSHGPHSTGRSLGRPSVPGSRTKASSDQKVEDYLRDTPDGLFPRHVIMTDKEKKKLVVRRLERLFTGKMGGKSSTRNQSAPSLGAALEIATSEHTTAAAMAPPTNPTPSREARIQPDASQKKPRSRDNLSTSNSNDDQTQSGGNGAGSGDGNGSGSGGRSGNNTSPPTAPPPEQRPTRPLDLDPDRVQVPSENLNYIRHLGLVPREFLVDESVNYENVSPDADGWVYLNLLCNLAQLHMFNVTPSFIRSAVSEKSTKFQLSPDGRKIRWRGGTDGTKFSSDSGENSQKSPSAEDTDGSNASGQRKKVKSSTAGGGTTSGTMSKFGPQVSLSSDSFHYKPLFVHQTSSAEMSMEETGSQPSDGALDDSNLGHSKWGYSGSGSSQRKKRRHDGAIIYYTGAPFCTDLSGDPGDLSPTTYLTSTGREAEAESPESPSRSSMYRTLSGSSLVIRPLSEPRPLVSEATRMDIDSPPELASDDGSWPDEVSPFPWGDDLEHVGLRLAEPILEPCGLGGVLPEDHFAVVVTTRRPIRPAASEVSYRRARAMSEDAAEAIARRLESMSTSSPLPPRTPVSDYPIHIEYLDGKVHRLSPAQLPPPAIFLPPFSTDSESDGSDELSDSKDEDMSDEPGDLAEEEVDSDEKMSDGSNDLKPIPRPPNPVRIASASTGKRPEVSHVGSSVATAGGAESGYSSSLEDEDS